MGYILIYHFNQDIYIYIYIMYIYIYHVYIYIYTVYHIVVLAIATHSHCFSSRNVLAG